MSALTTDDLTIVGGCLLFKCLDRNDLDSLLETGSLLTLARNQQLFAAGDAAKSLYLVLDGQIKLSRFSRSGDEAVVHVFGPGETFAEAAMFMGGRYPVAATAVGAVRLLAISNARLRARVLARPEIAFAMLGSMAQHLKMLVGQIEQMKLMTARERTIRFLLDQCDGGTGPAAFTMPHDKALVANRLGMTPETFSRTLAQLTERGVNVKGALVSVDDVARLAAALSHET